MKISTFGVDTIELKKRYRQHKNDLNHIVNDEYKSFQQKNFEIRSKKIRFHKSLNKDELIFVHSLVVEELNHA